MQIVVTTMFRHGNRLFKIGEIGEVVEVPHPLMYEGRPVFAYYAKFKDYDPVGVRKDESKRLADGQDKEAKV